MFDSSNVAFGATAYFDAVAPSGHVEIPARVDMGSSLLPRPTLPPSTYYVPTPFSGRPKALPAERCRGRFSEKGQDLIGYKCTHDLTPGVRRRTTSSFTTCPGRTSAALAASLAHPHGGTKQTKKKKLLCVLRAYMVANQVSKLRGLLVRKCPFGPQSGGFRAKGPFCVLAVPC